MPLISVIIPVYNSTTTIQTTLHSVFQQTFREFELIIVDDGSTDQTLEIVRQYQDNRLQVMACSHRGASVSRNQGLYQSKGEYIAFLDGDDVWTPDKLEKQFQALKANPAAAVAYSWTDYIDEVGNPLYPGSHVSLNGQVYPQLLIRNFLESGSNPLIERQALIQVGGFDESLQGGQDWDLYLRLAAKYQFITVPQVQIYYRVSSHSISSHLLRQEQQVIQVMERNFAQAPPEIQPLKLYSLMNVYKYLACRALALPSNRRNGLQALQFAGKYAWYEPKKRSQFKLILVLLIKSLIRFLFPSLEQQLMTWRKKT